jgi:hypothetical protein
VVIIGLGEQVEDDFTLLQNSPNPCDALTRIGFSLKTNEQVKIRLFDAAGFEIRTLYNDFLSKGTHYLNLETRNLRSGLYFYTLETASGRGGRQVRKLSIFH